MRHRRYHRDVLKSEEALITKVVRCPNLTHYDHVFDTNAVFPIGIIARFYTLLVNFGCDRGKSSAIPFETVMPGFSGVLLNAAQLVLSMCMGDALNEYSHRFGCQFLVDLEMLNFSNPHRINRMCN